MRLFEEGDLIYFDYRGSFYMGEVKHVDEHNDKHAFLESGSVMIFMHRRKEWVLSDEQHVETYCARPSTAKLRREYQKGKGV